MLILALDTSGDVCSVALFDGEQERTTLRFRHNRMLSERLPGAVRFVLEDAGLRLKEVEAFAAGLGPGSFTGVRVGVTLAKTFAHVLNRPLVGISSLDALAADVSPLPLSSGIVAVAPTRRTEVVAAVYRPGVLTPLAPPDIILMTETVIHARQALDLAKDAPLFVAGEAASSVREATLFPDAQSLILLPVAASASVVARLAARRLQNGESDDPFALTPLYVTPPGIRIKPPDRA